MRGVHIEPGTDAEVEGRRRRGTPGPRGEVSGKHQRDALFRGHCCAPALFHRVGVVPGQPQEVHSTGHLGRPASRRAEQAEGHVGPRAAEAWR